MTADGTAIFVGLVLLCCAATAAPAADHRLRVSEDGRFLVKADGAPFFWLADTAWQVFHRLSREEADLYLKNRADKRFTVIQAVAVMDSLTRPNVYGHVPFADGDPALPSEAYFQHVDYVVNAAQSLGMYTGLLPVWAGSHVRPKDALFTPANLDAARAYGRFLGRRYHDKAVVWVLGGDWPGEGLDAVWAAMAEGLAEGDGGTHLITYHPRGGQASSTWFHEAKWLSFNMIQSGHSFENRNYDMIAKDCERRPAKPVVDGEPGYEDHPSRFDPKHGWLGDRDVRRFAYCAVFAGAAGHTYGCHDIWQFWEPPRKPVTYARTPWKQALDLPGAGQMQHLRALVEARPMLLRVPDQTLVVGDPLKTVDRIQACRAADGSYAFIYTATGKPVTVRMDKLSGRTVRACWYDPRTGKATPIGEFPASSQRRFDPPSNGPGSDWVLVLDDAAKDYPLPGAAPSR